MQQRLVDALNDDGRIYLTQGAFGGQKVIRFQVGQFDTTRDDVMMAHAVIQEFGDDTMRYATYSAGGHASLWSGDGRGHDRSGW